MSIANIRSLAKTIKCDQPLAEQLWRTGNQDAGTLATLIADAKAMAADDLDYWALGLDYYMVADMFSANVAGNHPAAGRSRSGRPPSTSTLRRPFGTSSASSLEGQDAIRRVLRDLAGKDRTRHRWRAEPGAPRDERRRHQDRSAQQLLRARAGAVAERIGKVEVDHGETGYITPDALGYIDKAWRQRSAQQTVRAIPREPVRRTEVEWRRKLRARLEDRGV